MRQLSPLLLLLALTLHGAGPSRAAEPAPAEVRAAMARATRFLQSIATEGGYLWRYSADLKQRAGEDNATATQIWIQPPGTPSVGLAFLRAYQATQEAVHREAARDAARALARGQLESGGWDYSIDFEPGKFAQSYRRIDLGKLTPEQAAKRKNISTYDDNTTQSALRFLLEYAALTQASSDPADQEIRAALAYGLKKLLEAQYPNGAWPQRYDGRPKTPAEFPVQQAAYPAQWSRDWPKADYKNHYTLNDNALADCLNVVLAAHKQLGDPQFLAAARKAGDFLLLAQLPEPQPVWAQQYNRNMEPDWARAFEPPAVTGGESVGALRTLIQLHLETGDPKYVKTIPAALAWYQRSEIRPGIWARYYELKTNRPIYGDRDGKVHYTLAELSEERRTGYGWEGSFGFKSVQTQFQELQAKGRDALLAKRQGKPLSEAKKAEQRKRLAPKVTTALQELDAQGRWLTGGKFEKSVKDIKLGTRIETSVFIERLTTLAEYVELSAP